MIIKINAVNLENEKFSKGHYELNMSQHLGSDDFMKSIDLPGCCKLDFKFSAVKNNEKNDDRRLSSVAGPFQSGFEDAIV